MTSCCPSCGKPLDEGQQECQGCAGAPESSPPPDRRNGFDELVWLLTSWESPIVAVVLMALFFWGCFYAVNFGSKQLLKGTNALVKQLDKSAEKVPSQK